MLLNREIVRRLVKMSKKRQIVIDLDSVPCEETNLSAFVLRFAITTERDE